MADARQPIRRRPGWAAIAEEGRGTLATQMVTHLRTHGGLHSLDDFADYHNEYVTPIRAAFRGYEVVKCPPSGQGVVALMILKSY